MLAEISVWHADGSHEVLATDGTWKVARGALAGRHAAQPRRATPSTTEHIDGLHAPLGWDQPGFDDRRLGAGRR